MKNWQKKAGMVWLLLICISIIAKAQIQSAVISINGLTCSQCSKSVEMQLKKINSIQQINMDLKATTAHIQFKKNTSVDFTALAKAVTNAGFAVDRITATVLKDGFINISTYCYKINNQYFQSNNHAKANSNSYKIQLLGKTFGQNTKSKLIPACKQNNLVFFTFL